MDQGRVQYPLPLQGIGMPCQLVDVVSRTAEFRTDAVQQFHHFGGIDQHLFGILEYADTDNIRTAYAERFFQFQKLRAFGLAEPELKAPGALFTG